MAACRGRKCGGAVIPFPAELRPHLECLLGSPEALEWRSAPVFDPARVGLLAHWSTRLLADPRARQYPDIVTFAFWCRRAQQERSAERWRDGRVRVGLGLVFHMTPSNVPVNFAYSLAFAFLSGNASAVRLSERRSPQVDILVETLAQTLQTQPFSALAGSVLLMRYAHDDRISSYWLHNSLGRLIWGGDETVAAMRRLGAHPRSREMAFVDRYSLAALHAQGVLGADDVALGKLCEALYNDIYLMDQRACSSPQLLAWVGPKDVVARAQERLWPRFLAVVDSRQQLSGVRAVDKFVALCNEILAFDNLGPVTRHGNRLYRVPLTHLDARQQAQRGADGVVHEIVLEQLGDLAPLVDSRVQTLSYFGFSAAELQSLVLDHGLTGIDRMVPIGKALDMGWVWDGYEVVGSLSRLVDLV